LGRSSPVIRRVSGRSRIPSPPARIIAHLAGRRVASSISPPQAG